MVSKELLCQPTRDYQDWVEAFARKHQIPIERAKKGVRKEDCASPRLSRRVNKDGYGVRFIFKSMEQGRTLRISVADSVQAIFTLTLEARRTAKRTADVSGRTAEFGAESFESNR